MPLDCARAREQMLPFIDGALDPAGVARLRRHLGQCLRCAAELGEQRALGAMLAPERDVLGSEWLAAQVMARVAALPRHCGARQRVRVAPWVGRALPLAALLAVALLILGAPGLLGQAARDGQRGWAWLGVAAGRSALSALGDVGRLLLSLLEQGGALAEATARLLGGDGASPMHGWLTAALVLLGGAAVALLVRPKEETR